MQDNGLKLSPVINKMALYLEGLLDRCEVRRLAPIAVVMPFCSVGFEALAKAFERKAGSPFLNCFSVSLLKKIFLYK